MRLIKIIIMRWVQLNLTCEQIPYVSQFDLTRPQLTTTDPLDILFKLNMQHKYFEYQFIRLSL